MSYYLSPFVGKGTSRDPFKVLGYEQPGCHVVDLRADGGRSRDGAGQPYALVWLPEPIRDARVIKLGEHLREPAAQAALRSVRLKLDHNTPLGPGLDLLLAGLLACPPRNGWRRFVLPVHGHLGPFWRPSRRQLLALLGVGAAMMVLRSTPRALAAALATDNFNRANNADLGASWDVITSESAFNISSNTAIPSALGSDCAESYNGVSWPNDQYSQATMVIDSAGFGVGVGLAVRCATGARTYYRVVFQETNNGPGSADAELGKVVAGSFTSLQSINSGAVDGSVGYVEWQGTTGVVKLGGAQVGTNQADSAIASGRAGVSYSSTANSTPSLDDWEGGDFGTPNKAGPLTGGDPLKSLVGPGGLAR